MPNPRNWRRHPQRQREALAGALRKVGWVQNVVVNRRTGQLVDGHLRAELAAAEGAPAVPVVYVDLDEAEERLVLATLDPLAGMAEADPEALAGDDGGWMLPSRGRGSGSDVLAKLLG